MYHCAVDQTLGALRPCAEEWFMVLLDSAELLRGGAGLKEFNWWRGY